MVLSNPVSGKNKKKYSNTSSAENTDCLHPSVCCSISPTLPCLMLCMLGKNFSRQQFEIFFLFFPENRLTFHGDNLHEMSKPKFF